MFSVTLRVVVPVVLIVLSAFTVARPAAAEPQILGVVATTAPIQMRCENGECTANLATFCLEPNRSQPTAGDAYRPASRAHVQISRIDELGRRVPVETSARYFSDYYYTSVQVIVPEAAAAGGELYISALPGAALLPVSGADVENPHTPEETAMAVGQARRLASTFFENGDPVVEGAQLLNRALSLLPTQGRVNDDERNRIWQATLGSTGPLSDEGKEWGAKIYTMCQETAKMRVYYNMRGCLKQQNRQLLGNPNSAFWKSLKTGS